MVAHVLRFSPALYGARTRLVRKKPRRAASSAGNAASLIGALAGRSRRIRRRRFRSAHPRCRHGAPPVRRAPGDFRNRPRRSHRQRSFITRTPSPSKSRADGTRKDFRSRWSTRSPPIARPFTTRRMTACACLPGGSVCDGARRRLRGRDRVFRRVRPRTEETRPLPTAGIGRSRAADARFDRGAETERRENRMDIGVMFWAGRDDSRKSGRSSVAANSESAAKSS